MLKFEFSLQEIQLIAQAWHDLVEARLDEQLSVKSTQKLAPWQKTFTVEV